MNIHLDETFDAYVREQLATGRYNNASEVIRDALRLKMQAEEVHAARLEALRRDVGVGWDQMERGELVSSNLETFLSEHPVRER